MRRGEFVFVTFGQSVDIPEVCLRGGRMVFGDVSESVGSGCGVMVLKPWVLSRNRSSWSGKQWRQKCVMLTGEGRVCRRV